MRTIRTLIACCVAIAAALQSTSAFADDNAEGIARVSHCDSGCTDGSSGCTDGSCGCDTGCCTDGCCGDACCNERFLRRQMRTLKYGWHGEADWCPNCGQCSHDCNGKCKHGGRCHRGWLAYKLNCMFGIHGGASHAPGHGYVMPVKRPMWDVSYPYNHMLNATAMGVANGQQASSPYGNVYMPTDTTQLGYSYGHVPYWMPRAGMVPGTPNPESYHLRVCLPDRCNGHCGGTCPTCQHGGSCPTCQHGGIVHHGEYGDGQVVEGPADGLYEVTSEPTLAPVPGS